MGSTYLWATRCIPALSAVIVGFLLIQSFIIEPYGKDQHGDQRGTATIWQLILSVYTVFVHLQAISFPARLCWAIGDVIEKTKEMAKIKENPKKRKTMKVKGDNGVVTYPSPLFVIILPAYKEEMSTMEETLRVMAAHPQARHCYHVYLAMEEKEERASFKAMALMNTFEKSFYKISFTLHPEGIPGEAQGKSSNESWAGKQACKDYPEEAKANIIMTVMDADTHLSPRYFTQVAKRHTEEPETNQTSLYVPPLVFDRNLHQVPLLVRTSDLMWAGAGLSSLYKGSGVCIPTSVYSLPMTLVEQVGGWDTGPGAIGEDMHMYLKCFFALSGNLNPKIVYSAASQCNVSGDGHGLPGYFGDMKARYKQALRHMWGALDTGFAIREGISMVNRHRKAIQAPTEVQLSAPNSNWTAFYTSTGLDKSLNPKAPKTHPVAPKPIHIMNCLTIAIRLFEAHCVPIHLCTILTASSVYGFVYPSYAMPTALCMALSFSGWCRFIGWSLIMVFFYRYTEYHRVCTNIRKEEMRRADLLEEMEENDGFSKSVFQFAGLAEVAIFPLGGFLFGAIPALQAVISHVFTDRLTYVVSLKPQTPMKRFRGGNVTP